MVVVVVVLVMVVVVVINGVNVVIKNGKNMPPLGVYVSKQNSSNSHQRPSYLSAAVGILIFLRKCHVARHFLSILKVKQSRYRPGVARRFPGS